MIEDLYIVVLSNVQNNLALVSYILKLLTVIVTVLLQSSNDITS